MVDMLELDRDTLEALVDPGDDPVLLELRAWLMRDARLGTTSVPVPESTGIAPNQRGNGPLRQAIPTHGEQLENDERNPVQAPFASCMVRRGSAVRVRQRASVYPWTSGYSVDGPGDELGVRGCTGGAPRRERCVPVAGPIGSRDDPFPNGEEVA
jgi:hypothetical protein